jgi:hypothetical protein
VKELAIDNKDFPMPATDIAMKKFERNNSKLAINIYGWEGLGLYPIRVSPIHDRTMINLLLIANKEGKQHYCWIKNMSRMVAARSKDGHKSYVCEWCVSYATHSENMLKKHRKTCLLIGKIAQ